MNARQRTHGFILPSTILLSLAIAIITATFMQYTANSSQALNKQTYTSIAQEAADAGVAYAVSCVKQAANPSTWGLLMPNTNCNGANVAGISANVAAAKDGQWQSTFTIPNATVVNTNPKEQQVVATGIVKFYANGFQVGTVTVTRSVTLASSFDSVAVSTGNSLTALASDTHSCAIANGQLYCWGDNSSGQLGLGPGYASTNQVTAPTAVQTGAGQVFNNKMVTKVAVGTGSTCAIADGQLYCWGDNSSGQLGQGDVANRSVPTLVQAGLGQVFYNKLITNIAISKSTYTNKGACAVANGVTYCWGANTTQQLGQSTASTANMTPSYTPQRVYGYNSSDTGSALYQLKTQSVAIGSKDACSSTSGTVYCWGNTGSASPAPPAAVSSPYMLEPLSLKNIGATVTCGVVVGQMDCRNPNSNSNFSFGYYGVDPPNALSGTVDSFDGAENSGAPGDTGGETYCVWDVIYQALRCMGANTGMNGGNPQSNGDPNTNQRAVSVVSVGGVTGSRYGCAILNGDLTCWGTETQGQLADGNVSNTLPYATYSTVTPGFGTDNIPFNNGGQYPFKLAATGQISAGYSHECAIVHAKVVCWGSNSNGQLGTGDNNSQTQPTIIKIDMVNVCSTTWVTWLFGTFCPGPSGYVESPVEQIATGGNHSCAITDRLKNEQYFLGVGDNGEPESVVYCWGSNASGELGNGAGGDGSTANDSSKPVPVATNIMTGVKRITAISAGPQNTCAIDNFKLYCWGDNTYGQLGSTGMLNSNTPVLINSGGLGATNMQVTAVSVGTGHICAVANGNGYCWGKNDSGQLGTGSHAAKIPAPQPVTMGVAAATDGSVTAAFTAISAGNGYTCAIINGSVACWGRNDVGQLGNGTVDTVPTFAGPGSLAGAASSMQADALSAGDSHACAVLQARVYCWGNNANGGVGNSQVGGYTVTPSPVNNGAMAANVPLGATLNASINVAAGGSPSPPSATSTGTSCSVTNADIICWGAGAFGQIGIGGSSDVGSPTQIPLYRSTGSSTIGPIY